MNSCNKHDELKFNPIRWNSTVRERGNFAENKELFAPLPDENSRYKYLESCASEAVTWNISLTGNDKR